ncbi:ATP-binding protein [Pectinatus cerevisiiphilus]|uniref:ATP-binding protein n=1 Tax=Pectinatus cerevisiiphilus TaxID=86956 RepID=UPI003C7221FB
MDYSRFFERFYRGDTSHSNEKKGYGIGLSMAEELVHLIKGKIGVSYAAGMITFTVKIEC